ncbi:hypothetical protein TNCT_3371 [Trichonephila clavata]|uniref:Uncharacterized protein n=1 Tax=Trichonephila clavata TaxID=2740835 RepID=A0A8X6LXM6_TRICU|nr:hypothetical protein TNCT_3371 [Trichonephila clavata]
MYLKHTFCSESLPSSSPFRDTTSKRPKLLDIAHVSPSLRRSMWKQHDGTLPHYRIHVRHLWTAWIDCGDLVHCSTRSPDLSRMNFF